MSQAGINKITSAILPPEVPTSFQTDSQIAVPALHVLNVLGSVVAAGTNPFRSIGSGNTVTYQTQISQAIAATDATKIGLCNFDSTSFAVDPNGFVTLNGSGFTWNDVSGAFSPLKNNGYFVTDTATGTLPASPSQGDTIKFIVNTASSLTVQAAGGQYIRLANTISAVAGTTVSSAIGDSLELVFRASTSTWESMSFQGAWTTT